VRYKVVGWYSFNPHNEHTRPFARVVYIEVDEPDPTLRGFAEQDPALWIGINQHDYDASQETFPSGRHSTGRFSDAPIKTATELASKRGAEALDVEYEKQGVSVDLLNWYVEEMK
jgi:hypothetical protein